LNNNRVEPVQPKFGKIGFLDYVNDDGEGRSASTGSFVPEPFAFGGILRRKKRTQTKTLTLNPRHTDTAWLCVRALKSGLVSELELTVCVAVFTL